MPAIALLLEQAGLAAARITPEIVAAVEALIARGMVAEQAASVIASQMEEVEAGTAAAATRSPRSRTPSAAADRRAPGTAAVRRVRGSAQPAAPTPPASSKFKSFAKSAAGHLGTAAAFTVLPMLAMRLFEGSPEDQMRRSMEIQEQMEAERMSRMGGGDGGEDALLSAMGGGYGGMEGLVGRGEPMDSTDMKYADNMTKHVSDLAYKMKKAREARPSGNDELERIIAGESARIASLQSERVLTPLEIIQFAEMSHGAIP
jgi:hypothetical protein